jgi:hypothetical protein
LGLAALGKQFFQNQIMAEYQLKALKGKKIGDLLIAFFHFKFIYNKLNKHFFFPKKDFNPQIFNTSKFWDGNINVLFFENDLFSFN